MNASLGSFVSARRKELNLRQQDLADALGYTVQAISRFENGDSSMDIASLPALAALLKISLDDLYRERVSPHSVPCTLKFNYDLVGKNLSYLRLSHHFSREEVAQKVAISVRSLANYERGVSLPNVETVVALLDFYTIPADDLFGEMLAPVKPSFFAQHRGPLLWMMAILVMVGVVGATSPLWFPHPGESSNPSIGEKSSSESLSSEESSSSESSSSSSADSSSSSSSSGSSSSASSDDLSGVSVLGYVNGLSSATLKPGTASLTIKTNPESWYTSDKFSRIKWRIQESGSTDSAHVSLAADAVNEVWVLTIASDCLDGGVVALQVVLQSNLGSLYDHYSSQYVNVTFSNPA